MTELSTLVRQEFRAADGWDVSASRGPAQPWIRVAQHDSEPIPPQGWKVHVSAVAGNAAAVLHDIAPVLRSHLVTFKVLGKLEWLDALNQGSAGRSQIGKFITVYPVDDDSFTEVALAMAEELQSHLGPWIVTDRRVRGSSCVFYRFGSFSSTLMQTSEGPLAAAMTAPDGTLTPDLRQPFYVQPEWCSDPLEALGRSEPLSVQELLADRFQTVLPVREGTRHRFDVAVDLEQLDTCLIKRRVLPAYPARERDGLRNEARALESLAGVAGVPSLRAVVTDACGTALAIDEVSGAVSLEEWVRARFLAAGLPDDAMVELVWHELGSLADRIHLQGIVHGDIKSANVLVDGEDRLHVVDFELSGSPGTRRERKGQGTRGYLSQSALAGHPLSEDDDRFAVDALAFFVATGVEPSQLPDGSELADQPIALLNPALSAPLVGRLAAALSPNGPAPASRDVEDSITEACHELSTALLGHMEEAPGGLLWRSTHLVGKGRVLRHVNTGSAGSLLGLCAAYAATSRDDVAVAIDAASRALVEQEWPYRRLPGLFVGEAGVAVALLRAGHSLGESQWVDHAIRMARATAEIEEGALDVFRGTAGRLLAHLAMWRVTGESRDLELATEAGDRILKHESPRGSGLWRDLDRTEAGEASLGYSHGAAGVADALLRLHDASGCERFAVAAKRALDTVASAAIPLTDEAGLLLWPSVADGPRRVPYWCHGSAGIAPVFASASLALGEPRYRELARGGAAAAAQLARWSNPTLCHGVTGNAVCLLSVSEILGIPELRDEASDLLQLAAASAHDADGWTVAASETHNVVTPDYAVGFAGTLAGLARFVVPGRPPGVPCTLLVLPEEWSP
jgi:tRNA A-37 threonylcarbamoyl transferase component Bud32